MAAKIDYLVRLGDSLESKVFWCKSSKYASINNGTLQQASSVVAGGRVTVLVPANDVVLHHVALPPIKNRQHFRTAVLYAVEEQLSSPIDDVHCALGAEDKQGVFVAVVAHEKIQSWLDALKLANITPTALIPEQLYLASHSTDTENSKPQEVLYLDHEQAYLLPEGDSWFYPIATKNLANLKSLLPKQNHPTLVHQVKGSYIPDLEDTQLQLGTEVNTLLDAMFASWKQGSRGTINLLQNIYRPGNHLRKLLKHWRRAVVLFAVVAVLDTGIIWYEVSKLRAEHSMYRMQMKNMYRKTFPKAVNVVDPKLQMARKLNLNVKGVSSQDGFLVALEKISRILGKKGWGSLETMIFKGGIDKSSFDLMLKAKSLQHLDQLKVDLVKESGYDIEIINASSVKGVIEGRIKIITVKPKAE